jgi:hypothetical protein
MKNEGEMKNGKCKMESEKWKVKNVSRLACLPRASLCRRIEPLDDWPYFL